MGSKRILIADDYDPWRVQLCTLLRACAEWQIVGEARNGLEAVLKAAELRPDVVLTDIKMPELNGIEATKRIRHDLPNCKIIFVSQNTDKDIERAALNSGAHGYVLKVNAATDLVPTITAALNNYCKPPDALTERRSSLNFGRASESTWNSEKPQSKQINTEGKSQTDGFSNPILAGK